MDYIQKCRELINEERYLIIHNKLLKICNLNSNKITKNRSLELLLYAGEYINFNNNARIL